MSEHEARLVAEALKQVFFSPNVSDSNFEPANLVDTTNNIAKALWAIAKALQQIAEQGGGR